VLIAGCLVGVVLGSYVIGAVFKPNTPLVALIVGAGGFVAVVALIFFGLGSAGETSEFDVLAYEAPDGYEDEDAYEVAEPEAQGVGELETGPEPDDPEPLRDPLAADAGAPVTVARASDGVAALELAAELKESGDVDGAIEAYRAVAGTGDPMAGAAALNLGVLLAKRGDLDGAEVAYGQAVDAGGSIAKSAQVLLDLLARRRGAEPVSSA
jgi:hypothetical protein